VGSQYCLSNICKEIVNIFNTYTVIYDAAVYCALEKQKQLLVKVFLLMNHAIIFKYNYVQSVTWLTVPIKHDTL